MGPAGSSVNRESVSKLSSAINVRLFLEGKQDLPFVKFDNFDSLQYEEKIFLYGTSGSGKSRALFELVKNGIGDSRRIYVINPRNNVGDESGRLPLRNLVDRIDANDTVVWDNFPDDLVRRDMANAKRVLELLSSKYVRKLIVVLKPKYLEVFRDIAKENPEFFSQEITYSKEQFKKIMQKYGTDIPQFRETYEKHIAPNLEKISRILWNIEPIPLKVFDYYSEMKSKGQGGDQSDLDGVREAEGFLRSTNYYQHQFGLLSGMEERKSDMEFLCVLKMCYETGMDRTESNISGLQRAIFGSEPPKEAYNKLSNWLYISGQDYAMHDVCREAVRLSDYVKMKMLYYISENFEKIIRAASEQSVNLLGSFIGRNIGFVPLTHSTNGFLPNNVYEHMKRNAALEKSLGLGVGEVFQSLDDSLRNVLRNKCDTDIVFGMGMAEGLAQSFIFLDSEQRKLVLQKIYSGFLFARFFGKTLGLLLKDLDPQIRGEILPHVESNSQFADGIGMGVGPQLDTLDEDLRRDITERAKQNIALTRGLGFALASNIRSLDESQRRQVYSRTENNFQADVGLSFGLAEQYTLLPKEIQAEVLSRCDDHNGFAKGFGLYLILYTLNKCPPEVLSRVDRNGELAYSLGFGCGWMFPYLPAEFQSWAKSKSNENNRFERGFGFGMGLILRHLPEEDRNRQFAISNTRSEFDFGLGSGISFTWDCQTNEDKQAAYARCSSNNSFAQGIGYGHGYSFHYMSEEEKSETFLMSQNNSQFANGLGYGLGWSFPYSGDSLKNKMFEMAKTNSYFAFGLGTGLGQYFRYHSREVRASLFMHADENGWFARGLGTGLGRFAMSYIWKDLQEEVFLKTVSNPEFALGLGEGLGREFQFFPDAFKKRILDVYLPQSPFSARGLGIGFGLSVEYIPKELQADLYRRADENSYFEMGLGEGMGTVFQYLGEAQKRDLLARAESGAHNGFARGLGYGLGSVFPFLTQEFRNELLFQRAVKSPQLAMGLGRGVGSVFVYLPAGVRNSMLKLSGENRHFAIGLGNGIGGILFGYMGDEARSGLLERARKNPHFARGLGIGAGSAFRYFESRQRLREEILLSVSQNSDMAEGFGTGIGTVYQYLSEGLKKDMLDLAGKNRHFSSNFGFCLGHFVPTAKFEKAAGLLEADLAQNPEFGYGLGAGMGHNFPFLDVESQGSILNRALAAKEFGSGFGFGLAKSYGYLDGILEKEVLKRAAGGDSEFSYSLGWGLGNAFPSLDERLKRDLLGTAKTGHLFAQGFLDGIRPSMQYLDKDSMVQVSDLIEHKEAAQTDSKTSAAGYVASSLASDFLYDYFVSVSPSALSENEGRMQSSMFRREEVAFLGERKKCCVCFIDMVGSTKVTSQLDEAKLSKYYSIFLNSMATIIGNFNGKIIKNAGDALLYYFPNTVDAELHPSQVRNVLECGATMVAAHAAINSKMQEEDLPPINYRISADYGMVEVVRSQSSQNEDLFGFAMSVCAKINRRSLPNGMIVGRELHDLAEPLSEYAFDPAGAVALGLDGTEYAVYHVERKGERILQPFKHKPA